MTACEWPASNRESINFRGKPGDRAGVGDTMRLRGRYGLSFNGPLEGVAVFHEVQQVRAGFTNIQSRPGL